MSDEVKNEVKDEVKEEVKEEAKEEVKEENTVDAVVNSIKGTFSSLLSRASVLGNTVVEAVKDQAEKGKEVIEDKMREREADEIYRKLGKKVARLVKRGELELPECCQQYIEALEDLYGDDKSYADDADDKECCDKKDGCCCCEEKAEDNK